MAEMKLSAEEIVRRLNLAIRRGEIGVDFAKVAQADFWARRRQYRDGRWRRGERGLSPVRQPRFPDRFWAGQ